MLACRSGQTGKGYSQRSEDLTGAQLQLSGSLVPDDLGYSLSVLQEKKKKKKFQEFTSVERFGTSGLVASSLTV
jgi:hypothetical protein